MTQEHELEVNGNEDLDTTFDLGVSDDEKKTSTTKKKNKNGKVVPKLSPTIKSKSSTTKSKKGGLILKGCVCLVDVHIDDGDTSTSDVWKEKLTAMGARVVSQASSSLTHLVFKDGDNKRLNKLREKEGVECVSPQWIESCESAGKRLSESDFAAVAAGSGSKRKRTSGAARGDETKKKKSANAKSAESDEGEREEQEEEKESALKKKKQLKASPVVKRAAGRRSFVSPALKNKNNEAEEEEEDGDKKKKKKKTVAAKKSPAAKKRKAADESDEDDEEKKSASKKKGSSVKKSPAKKAKTKNSGEDDTSAKGKKKVAATKKTTATPTKKKSPVATPKRRKSKNEDDIELDHEEDDDEDVEDLQLHDDMGSEDEMFDNEEDEIDDLEDPTVHEQLWTDTNIREDLEGPEFKHLLAKNVVEFSSVSREDKEAMMGILRSFKETKLCTASRNTEFRGQRFSHLIVGEAKRTIKVLFAIAFGAAIVRPKYIFDAVEMDTLPDDKEYLCEEYAEAIERSRQANAPLSEEEMEEEEEQEEEGEAAGEKVRLKQQPFLKGVRIFIAGNTTPDAPLLGRLVKLCGGEVVKSVRAADYAILGRYAQRANYNRVTVLSEKWLLDGIEHYRMPEEVDQYVLSDAEIESLFVVDKKKPTRKSSSSSSSSSSGGGGGRKKQQSSKEQEDSDSQRKNSQTDSQKNKKKSKSNEEVEDPMEEVEDKGDDQEMENGDE